MAGRICGLNIPQMDTGMEKIQWFNSQKHFPVLVKKEPAKGSRRPDHLNIHEWVDMANGRLLPLLLLSRDWGTGRCAEKVANCYAHCDTSTSDIEIINAIQSPGLSVTHTAPGQRVVTVTECIFYHDGGGSHIYPFIDFFFANIFPD